MWLGKRTTKASESGQLGKETVRIGAIKQPLFHCTKARSFLESKQTAAKGNTMYFGVDYHPEQWVYPYAGTPEKPEAAWERDAELMVNAGVNVVRMGEFTWGLSEPEEGKCNFDWLSRVMDVLRKAGISVVLATPTA